MSIYPTLYSKFLTRDLIAETLQDLIPLQLASKARYLCQKSCHVAIMVPTITRTAHQMEGIPEPHVFYEQCFGNIMNWEELEELARRAARDLWEDKPNILELHASFKQFFSTGQPLCSGAKRQGIAAACSGLQPYFNAMIANMAIDACLAMASHYQAQHLMQEGALAFPA